MPNSYSNRGIDQSVAETNALSLGWHIGFYRFVLAVAGKSNSSVLDSENVQVLSIIRSRINELTRYFHLDLEIVFPSSPSECQELFTRIGREEQSKSGSHVLDVLSTHFGQDVGELYSFGHMLMAYALVASRIEPEIKSSIVRLEGDIRSASKSLYLPDSFVEDFLANPNTLAEPNIVNRIVSARNAWFDHQRQPERFLVEKIMGDKIVNYGKAGIVGSGKARDVIQNDWHEYKDSIDLSALAKELATLRAAMRQKGTTTEQDKAIVAVGSAEEAAKQSDGESMFGYLRQAGKWALDTATKIGTTVAVDAIKKAIGM